MPDFEPHDVPARDFSEPRDADFVADALLARLHLGEPDRGDFRNGIDAVGKILRRRRHRRAKGVAGGDAALLHRGRGEARKADHVARGIDMRHRGLERFPVDLEPPAAVGLDAAGFEPELLGRADAARRRRAASRCARAGRRTGWLTA